MAGDELKELLENAIREIEDAEKSLSRRDDKSLANNVWKAGSDVEYATFLMSLQRRGGDEGWKRGWRLSPKVALEEALAEAKVLLRQAIQDLNSNEDEAYRQAWFARGHILDVQNIIDRNRAKARLARPQRPS